MQFPFFKTGEPPKVYFLSLLIKPFKIGAILFEEINSKLVILSTHEVDSDKDANELSAEELLTLSDQAVSFVEGSLPKGANVEKTIFSVPYFWVEEGKIKKEYLVRLKKICQDLGLVPIGYIMSIEAVVHFLQRSEGVPVSAIFVEVAQSKVFVYLVRAGKVIEVKEGSIEGDVLKTVENLLKEIESVDVLPSKIILLDHKGAESVQQEFLSHQWGKEIPFLHIPQVMILEKGFENEATINGVASQMELEVLQDIRVSQEASSGEEDLQETASEDFGFVKDKDIAKATIKNQEEEPNITYFKKEKPENSESLKAAFPQEKQQKISLNLLNIFDSIKNLLPTKARLFKFLIGKNTMRSRLIIGLIGLVTLLVAFSFLYYNFILIAEISVFADKKAVDKTEDVVFKEGAESEGTNINIEPVNQEMKGDETKNSTGKKETGEKAKGNVTIYSSKSSEQTFAKGTVITAQTKKLQYTLNETVKVASSSGVTDVKTAKVTVTASEIGKEYNLPSATKFIIASFDSSAVEAKNDSAFSGGTKKETTVVSEKDLEDLLVEVTQKLEKNAILDVEKDLSESEGLLAKAISFDVVEKKYTKKQGDEAGSVGISATIKYSLGKYKKEDIERVVESLSKGEVPGTYALAQSDSKIEIVDIKINKDKTASARLKINAVYIPKIESAKLSDALRGKGADDAKKQIKTISGVTDVAISLKNKLPLFPNILPQNSKNIIIEVKD